MAKTAGTGWTALTVDDSGGASNTDIRNDVTNLTFATPRAATDVTGLDKVNVERLLLLGDFSITLNGQWNTAVSHAVFKTVCSATQARTTVITVNTASLQNGSGQGIETWYTDYQITRAAGGDLNWSAPGVLADGTTPTWV